ncbi:N-acetylmuramoyl-L-alanine amidase [Candidatus Fukatsuia symbiotica]|uniref:N-acetylmuramoyl-L-alanine amidase n=1 Tax=Candidatus Fukatsuia symbiotica TaxID=1878942 RepID=A0A2U8I5N2_9GAMM|nr:N-acetylmuramoyl-L-alanine amidase [Candidatus Fukatsuia symbiotica]AWK14440.1 N-acetylmuramoyl-L-alanine amidase [Candidatus Fukatsuia symbiotica]MEA9444722.1 N-acetylmuramoyl-L-alanine amidase [Candidatus Fukatsuia symbiotica]
MIAIDNNSYRSKGFNSRKGSQVRFLVMHYTASNFLASVSALTGQSVSVHYLVPNPVDPTYISTRFKELKIFNLVDEKERAWHAGVSAWENHTNLNNSTIGIEIVNEASEIRGVFTFLPYNDAQIEAVKQLALSILQRYPDISPTHVVGHSDISLGRKSDPGATFPWFKLYEAGIGAWHDATTKCQYIDQYRKTSPSKETTLALFKKYGYNVSQATTPEGFKALVRAFQLHFRPYNYDGVMDIETSAILAALVEKYFPQPRD